MISQNIINQIIEKVNIAEVIAEYIQEFLLILQKKWALTM